MYVILAVHGLVPSANVRITHHKLESLGVSKSVALERFECRNNAVLAFFDLSCCSQSGHIECASNKSLTRMTMPKHGDNQQKLNCMSNDSLTALDLSGCSMSRTLDICNNRWLAKGDFRGCCRLKPLFCTDNPNLKQTAVSWGRCFVCWSNMASSLQAWLFDAESGPNDWMDMPDYISGQSFNMTRTSSIQQFGKVEDH